MSIHNLGHFALSAAVALGLAGFAAAQQMPANPAGSQGDDAGQRQVNATGAVSGQTADQAAPQATGSMNNATGQTNVTNDASGQNDGTNDGMTDGASQVNGANDAADDDGADDSGQQASPPNPPNPANPPASGQTGTMNPPAGTSGTNPPAATGTENPPAATGTENPPAATGTENPPAATGAQNRPSAANQPRMAQPRMTRTRTVTIVQRQLRRQGLYGGPIDGIEGPGTRAAITRFQRQHRITVTGRLNPATMRELGVSGMARETSGEASRAMEPGMMHSTQVIERVQRELRGEGLYHGRIDGIEGPATHSAIRSFQRQENIPVTGSLNRTTIRELHIFRPSR
jgi:peptidoglycan hydrolase-like protein with peptidoglycan-binding domain